MQVRDLTELKVEDLWREVKGDEEDLFEGQLRKRLVESAMEGELLESLGRDGADVLNSGDGTAMDTSSGRSRIADKRASSGRILEAEART